MPGIPSESAYGVKAGPDRIRPGSPRGHQDSQLIAHGRRLSAPGGSLAGLRP